WPTLREEGNVIRNRRALEFQNDAHPFALLTAHHFILALFAILTPHRSFLHHRLNLCIREPVGFLARTNGHQVLEFVFLPRVHLVEHNGIALWTHILRNGTDERIVFLHGSKMLLRNDPSTQREHYGEKCHDRATRKERWDSESSTEVLQDQINPDRDGHRHQ